MSRLKILVSAYACSPYQGSEPGVGWGFVAALAEHHDLWVIVEEEKFRSDIERYLATHPEFSRLVRFFFIRKERHRTLRKLWPPSYYWFYRRWHLDAFRLARRLHAEVRFDLAHQLTMVGFREPGFLRNLDVPLVWGPIGGMGFFPWRFLTGLQPYDALYYAGYNAYNWVQMKWFRRPKATAREVGRGLLTATPENQSEALKYWGVSSSVLTEVGPPAERAEQINLRTAEEPLRIVWVGQHIARKALNLAVEAVAKMPAACNWQLHIVGDGNQTMLWKRLVARRGIESRCLFYGRKSRAETLGIMRAAHAMVITSLRDLTSTVTIEALACGLPIICLDHCGFSFVVDDTCGIKVPVTRPQEVVSGLVHAFRRIEEDEPMRRELAAGALRRVENFAWDKKVALLNRIYAQVLSSKE